MQPNDSKEKPYAGRETPTALLDQEELDDQRPLASPLFPQIDPLKEINESSRTQNEETRLMNRPIFQWTTEIGLMLNQWTVSTLSAVRRHESSCLLCLLACWSLVLGSFHPSVVLLPASFFVWLCCRVILQLTVSDWWRFLSHVELSRPPYYMWGSKLLKSQTKSNLESAIHATLSLSASGSKINKFISVSRGSLLVVFKNLKNFTFHNFL